MNPTTHTLSPLRQRFLDDMRMRKLSPKTQSGYIRTVSRFYGWLGRSPDTATAEDLRRYQLHLVDHGISPISLNVTITGLKFFFESTLDRPELMWHMHPVHVPRKIPVVLSPDEVARLIGAAGNLKNQTALSVAYGAGLRVSEVAALKAITDMPFKDAPSRARRQVKHGDIIVSTGRTYLKAIAAVENPPENLVVSTGFAVLRPHGIAQGFAKYAFAESGFINTVIARSNGVSYPAINATDLVRIPIPVPPLDEQQAIAAYLDRETASIDKLVDHVQDEIKLLQELRSATITDAVTGKIQVL